MNVFWTNKAIEQCPFFDDPSVRAVLAQSVANFKQFVNLIMTISYQQE
jgi:hypothetical protein